MKCMKLLPLLSGIIFTGNVFANEDPVQIKIQAQQPGSSYYSYATTLSGLLNKNLPENSVVQIIPRGGSTSNPTLLNAGKADVAFGLSFTTKLAYVGDKEVYGNRGPHKNILSITGGMHDSYTLVMARKSYLEETGYNSLEEAFASDDLPTVGMKPQGSVVIPIADILLSTLGTSVSQLRDSGKLVQARPSQLGEMMRDNRIDIYFENVPTNHAGVTEVSLTNELVFLPLPQAALDKLASKGMFTTSLAKDSYKGMNSDYQTAATSMVIMANKSVPDDVIYQFTKTLVEGRDIMIKENAALSHWDPKKGMDIKYTAIPLHPGAERYYKELGW